MEGKILSELQQIKQLALLAAKQALTVTDASLFTGLGKSRIYKPVCAKKLPYCKGQGGKLTRFDRNGLTSWQLKHGIKTGDEMETEAAKQKKGINMPFSCHLKMERRQSVKKDGTESKTPRYAVTAKAGCYKPLQSVRNAQKKL